MNFLFSKIFFLNTYQYRNSFSSKSFSSGKSLQIFTYILIYLLIIWTIPVNIVSANLQLIWSSKNSVLTSRSIFPEFGFFKMWYALGSEAIYYLVNKYVLLIMHSNFFSYLIPIRIRAPLIFAPLIFAPLIIAHPQSSRLFNFFQILILL